MREKELGDEQVRVTVRLPQGLYDAVRATRRQRWGWGARNISLIIRDALQHYLTCPACRQADQDARQAWEERTHPRGRS